MDDKTVAFLPKSVRSEFRTCTRLFSASATYSRGRSSYFERGGGGGQGR